VWAAKYSLLNQTLTISCLLPAAKQQDVEIVLADIRLLWLFRIFDCYDKQEILSLDH
jgi:hypothetical protein